MIEVANLSYKHPGGVSLLEGVSFKVPDGYKVALVGANGTGKTTLLRLIAGEDRATSGQVRADGRIAYMPQFIGMMGETSKVRDLLLRLSSASLMRAGARLQAAEASTHESQEESAHLEYADALVAWGEAGGFDAEVLWDTCSLAALGKRLEKVSDRLLSSLSGGEQKRLALEVLLRSEAQVLLLDEPDNFLDILATRWLEQVLNESTKTILFVSHDRALLAAVATRVVTIEGHRAWTHPGSYATYHEERARRLDRLEEEHRRFQDERDRLTAMIREFKQRSIYNDKFATKAASTEKRLERFERDNAPPELARPQDVKMRLQGGRTGKIALRATALEIPGIVRPFNVELYYGERVGVVGSNGTGKSHFLRLLAGESIDHRGNWKLGARVTPGLFSQTHDHPELADVELLEVMSKSGLRIEQAMPALKRYELHRAARTPFSVLSGGQQARFQILMLEMASPTMLLLDEPTDNLDVDSAEALEQGLAGYEGTVVTVTHDRWFMRSMDRFLVFGSDGVVQERIDSPYLVDARA